MRHDSPAIELWVGPECTINRVGERWRDQSELTGFGQRAGDMANLASLGARKVRLPVLWERAAGRPGELDFSRADELMAAARDAGIEPIVGLLHHGSGPRHTSLIDAHFPVLFADYARQVAERYPTQTLWTPINEPLTTARFSCLYGLWYPHAADDGSFVRALLNQVHATSLAMREIRRVNAAAQLLQTDDLGFTRCTPSLQDQADFDNERRWLGFDLLCGRVDDRHPMHDWLRGCGASGDELARLREEPCPPDIIGINAYVTSERFLDERLHLHPSHLHGGNGRQVYVDTETARVHGEPIDGFAGRLREAHARYARPLAITEVHLGCTREEQMRWLAQAWRAAEQARGDGVDVRAVTAWAAFGTVDWNSLLTNEAGHYEPGLWDIRSDPPRRTALADLAAGLAQGGAGQAPHPVLAGPGWWQRDLRRRVPPHGTVRDLPARGAPLLIIGAGALAGAMARLAHMRGLPYERCTSVEAHGVFARSVERHRPWAVVDAAFDEDIDAAERDPDHWHRHRERTDMLAAACARAGLRFLLVSDEHVFSGQEGIAYVERHPVSPINASGRAKAHAEQALLSRLPEALVIRSAAVFGPWNSDNFVTRGIALARQGRPWPVAEGSILSPTYIPDLVQSALDLLIDGERGIWHLTHGETLSSAEFAERVLRHAGLDKALVHQTDVLSCGRAPRPPFGALLSERGMLLPSLDDALSRYQVDYEAIPQEPPPLRAVP